MYPPRLQGSVVTLVMKLLIELVGLIIIFSKFQIYLMLFTFRCLPSLVWRTPDRGTRVAVAPRRFLVA